MVRNLVFLFLLTASAVLVSAEPKITAELSALNIISMQNDSWSYSPLTAGKLDMHTPSSFPLDVRLQLHMAALLMTGADKSLLTDHDMLPMSTETVLFQIPRGIYPVFVSRYR